MPRRPTFKSQIESIPGRINHEIFGYKKPRKEFIDKTAKADEYHVTYNERQKYITGEYIEIHTHHCNPKIDFESTPSTTDLLGWIDDYLTTYGKKRTAVVSSTHFKTGEELGRVHIVIKKEALRNQLQKKLYDCYLEFMSRHNRSVQSFENFNADLFFLTESGKARRYLNDLIEKDFNFEERLESSKTKDLREIFIDIEKNWGIKIRPFSLPGHSFDYKRGTFY